MVKGSYFLARLIKSKSIQLFLGSCCTALILLIDTIHFPFFTPFMEQLNNLVYDEMVQMNWRPHQENPQVVLIDIDNKSVQTEGRWPWPRGKMAALIKQLKQSGVVTIGTDIVMSEAEVNYALGLKEELQRLIPKLATDQEQLPVFLDKIAPQVDNDQIFANTLLDHNVVLGFLFHNDQQIRKGMLPRFLSSSEGKPLNRNKLSLYEFSGYNGCLELFLKAAGQAGAVTNLPDLDGTVRHGVMLASYDNKLYPTLALAIAMNYLLVDHLDLKIEQNKLYGLQMGGLFIPTNSHGQILIPFWGQPGTLNYYSATDIIQGKINPKQLQGAIAVIGSTMILLADLHQSPVAQSFPGLEMVGNMVQGIVGQQLLAEYDWQTTLSRVYLLLIGLLVTFLFSFLGVTGMLLTAVLSISGFLAVSAFLFAFKNLYLPPALILSLIVFAAITNYAYLFIKERRQKKKINQLFGQYVPEAYVKELIESPDQYSMEGQVRTMTVQFSDIRNFTSISEALGASDVKRLLNTFFTPITEIIFSFRGTIDKYVGDMIVAFWGAPIPDEEHAYHAIMSSLAVIKKLPEINQKMIEKNLPAVNIGIGLATGLMNVGDMGSEFRRAYTVLGDTVNLASRLQDLTKFYHVAILVSEGTRAQQDLFVWRTIDKITVKGRKTGLTIYQPLGMVGEVSEDVLTELAQYHEALADYYAQNWPATERKFAALSSRYPDIYLYPMYLERIKAFMVINPPQDWDGIYVHQHK